MANSLADRERELSAIFEPHFDTLGFEQVEPLIFSRREISKTELVRFPARLQRKVVVFNANAAIRFNQIESLLGEERELYPPVVVPIQWLRPDRKIVEWAFDPAHDEQLVKAVFKDIHELVIPFFRQLVTLEDLKVQFLTEIEFFRSLREPKERANSEAEKREIDIQAAKDPFVRLNIDPVTRIKELAAIYVIERKKDLARLLIDNAIAEIEETVPPIRQAGRRRLFEDLAVTLGLNKGSGAD
jgi:hypothetical protein